MYTPTHLLVGAAAFGRKGSRSVLAAAFIGSLLPDLSLYVMAGVALFVMRIPPEVVFGQLYYSDVWQSVFAVDNSFFVWGALLALGIYKRVPWAIALCAAALLHLLLDFPLHHDDGRAHFWPVSSWIFESPLSYWDRTHGSFWVTPVEVMIALISAVLLWRANIGWALSIFVAVLLAADLWIAGIVGLVRGF